MAVRREYEAYSPADVALYIAVILSLRVIRGRDWMWPTVAEATAGINIRLRDPNDILYKKKEKPFTVGGTMNKWVGDAKKDNTSPPTDDDMKDATKREEALAAAKVEAKKVEQAKKAEAAAVAAAKAVAAAAFVADSEASQALDAYEDEEESDAFDDDDDDDTSNSNLAPDTSVDDDFDATPSAAAAVADSEADEEESASSTPARGGQQKSTAAASTACAESNVSYNDNEEAPVAAATAFAATADSASADENVNLLDNIVVQIGVAKQHLIQKNEKLVQKDAEIAALRQELVEKASRDQQQQQSLQQQALTSGANNNASVSNHATGLLPIIQTEPVATQENAFDLHRFRLPTKVWESLSKKKQQELQEAEALLKLLAQQLEGKKLYSEFKKKAKHHEDVTTINAGAIKIELRGSVLEDYFKKQKNQDLHQLTEASICRALALRLKYVPGKEHLVPANEAVLMKRDDSPRQTIHQDNKDGSQEDSDKNLISGNKFGIMALTDGMAMTQVYDVSKNVPAKKELTMDDIKTSPLFQGASDSLIASLANNKKCRKLISDYGRLAFATPDNRIIHHDPVDLLSFWIQDASTPHNAPPSSGVRNSLFFTLNKANLLPEDMYSGETQMSKVMFLIQNYENLEDDTTTLKKDLRFFLRLIETAMMDEWEEGAEDQNLNEFWEEVQAHAKEQFEHFSDKVVERLTEIEADRLQNDK